MNLKELKDWARKEKIKGFSKMKKTDLEKNWEERQPGTSSTTKILALDSFPTKFVPNVVETSVDKAMNWAERLKIVKDKLKEKTRQRLLKLNAKIGELLKKPEFEIEKKPGLGGVRFVVQGKEGYSAQGFLRNLKPSILETLKNHPNHKTRIVLTCRMIAHNLREGTTIKDEARFFSNVEEVFQGSNLERVSNNMIERILENMQNFQLGRSNWRFSRVERLEIQLDETVVGRFIPLPSWLAAKQALINMKNEDDDECFKWCIGRSQNPVKNHPERITPLLRTQCEEFDWSNSSFPISWRDIDRFERNNNISVNVLGEVKNEIVTLRKAKKKEKHVILFKLKSGENEHFALVKSLRRLWFGKDSKNRSSGEVCDGCLNSFPSKEKFEDHQEFCINDGVRGKLPKEGGKKEPTMKFQNQQRSTTVPFVIFADFDSVLKPVSNEVGNKTTQIQQHIPCSFCFLPVSNIGVEFSPVFFSRRRRR